MSHCSLLKAALPEKPIGVSPFLLRGDVLVTSVLRLANDTSTLCCSLYFFPFRQRVTFFPRDWGHVLRLSNCSHLRAARPYASFSSKRGGVLTIIAASHLLESDSAGCHSLFLSLIHSLSIQVVVWLMAADAWHHINLGFESRRTHFYVFWNGATSLTRGRAWLLLFTSLYWGWLDLIHSPTGSFLYFKNWEQNTGFPFLENRHYFKKKCCGKHEE
jgi:hypothetical protein